MIIKIILVIISYLLGAIPFAYIMIRWTQGVDIREVGSGNVGSTNAMRTAGKKVALAALLGDLLKGFIAAWLGLHYGGEWLGAACLLAAVIGHCWPVYLSFSGGRGAATAAGGLILLMPTVILVLLVIFLLIVVISRYVSLASISVAVLLPLIAWFMSEPRSYVVMSIALAVLVVYRHRDNIERLRNGSERKIGS
ncbi:MAG TPA: glycerol-3-phosphate 1-O-acyltransferase PlsY [Syntrophomonas sp.]|nr:glycerol-3-phosphate 1-O-acyltransferase PlsY [Syntrophomonas sp.]